MSAVQQMRALLLADSHMKEAGEAARHLLGLKDASLHLRHAIYTGIVVTYARSFMATIGVSQLPKEFEQFPEMPNHERLHAALLDARNKIYAHHDATALPSDQPSELQFVVTLDGRKVLGQLNAPRGQLLVEYLDDIVALCAFQRKRMGEGWAKYLRHLSSKQAALVDPGTYTVHEEEPHFRLKDEKLPGS